MKLNTTNVPYLTQNVALIVSNVGEDAWEDLYEVLADKLGGFVGISAMLGDWGYAFFKAEPDGEQLDNYIDALKIYTDRCVQCALKTKYDIHPDVLKEIAKAAIGQHR